MRKEKRGILLPQKRISLLQLNNQIKDTTIKNAEESLRMHRIKINLVGNVPTLKHDKERLKQTSIKNQSLMDVCLFIELQSLLKQSNISFLYLNKKVERLIHIMAGHDEYSVGRKVDPGSLFDWTKIGL